MTKTSGTNSLKLFLNGIAVTAKEGTKLSDILPDQPKGTSVAVIRKSESAKKSKKVSSETVSLRFTTTAGEIVVELLPGVPLPVPTGDLADANLRTHWEDKYAAAFGPFPADFIPDHNSYRYDRGIVSLGCGGYDPHTSYLVFSRLQHVSDHGAAAGGGIIGKVVSGLGIMNRWRNGDKITKIEQVFSSTDVSNAEVTADLSLPLKDGMQIFSEIVIGSEGYTEDSAAINTAAADSVEHMLFCLRDKQFIIDQSASTYIRDHEEGKLYVPQELQKPRREGTVTVRTGGKGSGALYIYTQDVSSNAHHTRVGTVLKGIELAKFAKKGAKLSVKTFPKQLDLRGLPLGEAVAKAKERGLKVLADNRDVDGRVVISQEPGTTLEVLQTGKVALRTVALEDVISITLDHKNAPLTIDAFRRETGLKIYAIGAMPFFFDVEEEMYLFKPEFASSVALIPENTPKDSVPPFVLAITNDSRKARGMVGVRTTVNDEYGPTGEPFGGTNIIGTIVDAEKLKNLKEGATVYIREVSK